MIRQRSSVDQPGKKEQQRLSARSPRAESHALTGEILRVRQAVATILIYLSEGYIGPHVSVQYLLVHHRGINVSSCCICRDHVLLEQFVVQCSCQSTLVNPCQVSCSADPNLRAQSRHLDGRSTETMNVF